MAEEHQKEAAKLGFDLTKQFLTLAFGGIAFVVGIASSRPDAVSKFLLWSCILIFAASSIFGLLFLMRGVSRLNEEQSFDIYAISLRVFSGLQIVFVALGVLLLCLIVRKPADRADRNGKSLRIQLSNGSAIAYPIDSAANITVEVDGTRVKMTGAKP